MDRALLAKCYRDFWSEGLWAAPWSKALVDLAPQQALFKPAAGRKSIWQIVSHVTFWRDYHLDRLNGSGKLSDEQVMARQYAEPDHPTPGDWSDAQTRLRASHDRMVAAVAETTLPIDKLLPVLAHDAYHLGQIMYIRALQGLKPID